MALGGGVGPVARSRYAANGHRRRQLRARLAALGLPCAICGDPIDYSLPAGDPGSFEVDEALPCSLGGSELDWDNVQPAHRLCNRLKGNRIHFALDGFGQALEMDAAGRSAKGRAPKQAAVPRSPGPTMAGTGGRW